MEGFEQSCDSLANKAVFDHPEALGEAVDADLAQLVEIWPTLDAKTKGIILSAIDSAS